MMKVAVLLGSENDLPIVKGAFSVLKELEIPFTVHILSAHRTSEDTAKFADEAASNGYGVLIAAAGKAAHLAGALAARTMLPIIGLPLSASLDGLDALLSTVQMPSGFPVATVAIDGAANAGLLAAQILALSDSGLTSRLQKRREAQAEAVRSANNRIQQSFTTL